jgi:hypothetical protein
MNRDVSYLRSKSYLFFLAGMLFLFLAGMKWAWRLPTFMDITFGDEAQYMRYGLDLFHSIKKDWGPSYNIWYKLLSFFQSNPVKLFYLNYQVTAILLALLLFVFLVYYNISQVVSLWMSFCFLLSTTVIDTWPRVSHFAVIVLLACLIAVRNVRTNSVKLLCATLAFYIAAYARPELFSAFVILAFITLVFLFRDRSNYRSWLPLALLVAAIGAANFFIYRLPADSYKGINRTYIAFCQHYAINYVIEHKASFNPISEWIDFARQTFGACNDFGCILKTHTSLVVHNSLLNLKNYLLVLLQFVVSILVPVKIIGSRKIQMAVVAALLGLIIFVLINKAARNRLMMQLKAQWLILLILFLFGLPSMGTSVLIFPRQHYLLMHCVLLIYLIALCINSVGILQRLHPAFCLLLFPLLLVSPTAARYNYYQLEKENKNHCNQCLTEYLTNSNNGKSHVIFSNHLSLSMMLPSNYSDFNTEYEYKPGMRFDSILKVRRIDRVVVRPILLHERLLNSDSTWTNFLQHPALYDFRKVTFCDSCESYLLVKE